MNHDDDKEAPSRVEYNIITLKKTYIYDVEIGI